MTTRVLVAEDEQIVAMDLRATLEELGYEVLAVLPTAEEALEVADREPPDIALLDVRLAGEMDGIEAGRRLRDRHGTPIVFLTAHSDVVTLERSRASEPLGYVVKPYEERELHVVLETALARHRLERALRESERRLDAILASVADAVVALDPEGRITFLNPPAESLLGAAGGAIGRPLEDLLAWHVPPDAEGRGILEAGSRRVAVERTVTPLRGEAGDAAGTVHAFHDVTERIRVQGLLDLLYRITSAANAAASVEDAAPAALEEIAALAGWDQGVLYLAGPHGRLERTGIAFPAGETAAFQSSLARGEGLIGSAVLDRRPAWTAELPRSLREAGFAGMLAVPILGSARTAGALAFLSREPIDPGERFLSTLVEVGTRLGQVADRVWIHEERVRRAELERAHSELRLFAQASSHNLREPLRVVSNYLSLFQGRLAGRFDEQAEHYYRRLVHTTERMLGLIDRIFEYCQVGMRAPDLHPVGLDAVLDEALASLQLVLAEAQATIEREPLGTALGDPYLLSLVFQNLLENAVKFRREEVPLSVRIDASGRDDGLREIAVRDNGLGVEAELAAAAFEPFQRLHSGERFAGPGLGLTLCKLIVERHGGTIRLDPNAAGQPGATARFTLPEVDEPAGRTAAG